MAKISKTVNADKNDEHEDDSTQRACCAQARRWGSLAGRNDRETFVGRQGK
jgi:hypothetical protein